MSITQIFLLMKNKNVIKPKVYTKSLERVISYLLSLNAQVSYLSVSYKTYGLIYLI